MIKYELFLSEKRVERAKKSILSNRLWKYKDGGILHCVNNNKHIYGIVLAKDQSKYIGCCFYTEYCYSLQTFVSREYRRKGIGKEMLSRIRKVFPSVYFEVDDYFAANKRFYSHLRKPCETT